MAGKQPVLAAPRPSWRSGTDPGSRMQPAAVASCGHKLQCLRIRVRQISRERDTARLELEGAERRCLRLLEQLDEQRAAHEHSQGRLRKIQAEMKAKDLLLQQATQRQAKLEASAQLLQDREADLQGRLSLTRKENTQLQNKVVKMSEKLSAMEKLVLELQKELDLVRQDKPGQAEPCGAEGLGQQERFAGIILEYEWQCRRVKVLWEQNKTLRRELQGLRVQDSARPRGDHQGTSSWSIPLPAHRSGSAVCAGTALAVQQLHDRLQDLQEQLDTKVIHYQQEMEVMRKSFEMEKKSSEEKLRAELAKVQEQKRDLEERAAKYRATTDGLKEPRHVRSPELEEAFGMERQQYHKGRGERRPEQAAREPGTERLRGASLEQAPHSAAGHRPIEELPVEQRVQIPHDARLEHRDTRDRNRALEGQVSALKRLLAAMAPASLSA